MNISIYKMETLIGWMYCSSLW